MNILYNIMMLEKGTFEFVALRHIIMDEEITVCYGGDNYWNDGRNTIEVKEN